MPQCDLPPNDKRTLAKNVGDDLLSHHGKKKFYSAKEVKGSMRRLDYPVDWDCWAMALFLNEPDFTIFHDAAGEECNYASMKGEMAAALMDEPTSWFSPDLSWLELPDVDFSSIFDFFDIP